MYTFISSITILVAEVTISLMSWLLVEYLGQDTSAINKKIDFVSGTIALNYTTLHKIIRLSSLD